MVAGVGMFGTFSGFVAAWFLAPDREKHESDLSEIKKEIGELKKLLSSARHSDSDAYPKGQERQKEIP